MKNKIIKTVLIFSILTVFFNHLNAQSSDNALKELINSGNWFGLDREYHQNKDSIKSPLLSLFVETILKIKFNQPNAAISSIDTLLYNYQKDIGFENTVELFRNKLYILEEQGEYEYAANELKNFIDQISQQNLPEEEFMDLKKMYTDMNYLRHTDKPSIFKPKKDVEIPFGTLVLNITSENAEDTLVDTTNILGIIKISIQEKEYIFMLDTGCEKTGIFNNISNDINLHYLSDSIDIIGTEVIQGKSAILDSISLGGVTLYNSIVFISDNVFENTNTSQTNKESLHGVIGMDFIKRIGEIQLYPHDRKIIIPHEESELPTSGRNIILDESNRPIIKAFNKDDLITFIFDTGTTKSDMYKSYYLKNKEAIETKLEKGASMVAGVGTGFKLHAKFKMPSLPLSVNETSFSLEDLDIFTENTFVKDPKADGSLGMDFIKKFSKVTLNMNKMFIQLEK